MPSLDAIASFLQDGTSPFYRWYVAAWVMFCLAAGAVLVRDRHRHGHELPLYLRSLTVPWKLALFAPAFLFVTFAGSFAHDHTWDVASGGGMALLTYLTAPWAVGIAWKVAHGQRPRRDILPALAACLFSASWFYDGYLLWRDGVYGALWLPNLFISPYLYVAAGVLWSLEGGKGPRLSFMRPDWPEASDDRGFRHVLPYAIPLVVFAAVVLLGSVRWQF